MCAKHQRHQLDRFLTKACAQCVLETPIVTGLVQTERFRYRVERGRRKLVKKHFDALRQW